MENLALTDNQFRISCLDEIQNSTTEFIVTSKAYDTICRIKDNNDIASAEYIRISAYSGGCAGVRHDLGFDSNRLEGDKVLPCGELTLVIDSDSLVHMQGVTLDYKEGLQGTGFVFNNPRNTACHGCFC